MTFDIHTQCNKSPTPHHITNWAGNAHTPQHLYRVSTTPGNLEF